MLTPEPNKKLVVKQVVSVHLGWNIRNQLSLSVYGMITSDGNIQVIIKNLRMVLVQEFKYCFELPNPLKWFLVGFS